MRNRAKCKKCESIIESFHIDDRISCQCGEIALEGDPENCKAFFKNSDNFIRVDDEGNEILLKWSDPEEKTEDSSKKLTKKDLLDQLDLMIKNYESIPDFAKSTPINHYDYISLMILISLILKSDD